VLYENNQRKFNLGQTSLNSDYVTYFEPKHRCLVDNSFMYKHCPINSDLHFYFSVLTLAENWPIIWQKQPTEVVGAVDGNLRQAMVQEDHMAGGIMEGDIMAEDQGGWKHLLHT
jgi:hypothetical protein